MKACVSVELLLVFLQLFASCVVPRVLRLSTFCVSDHGVAEALDCFDAQAVGRVEQGQ